jgi:integrase
MDTKSGTRAIPMSEAARAVLDSQVRHVRSPYVFVDSTGEPYHTRERRNTISKSTKQTMRAAGIQGATFHSLRHTAASWMVQAGRPLAEVKVILGHATMQTTLRCAHLQPEHLRASIATLDKALGSESIRAHRWAVSSVR